jgi:hypothetical protein
MKKKLSSILAIICAALISVSCAKDNTADRDDLHGEARVWFTLQLDEHSGVPMSSKATNSEVYAEFHQMMSDGSLAASKYSLTLTEVVSGQEYKFEGTWGDHEISTIKSGKYKLEGTAIAEGDYIQEKCSFSFDQTVDVAAGDNEIRLLAKYESFLLIFSSPSIKNVQNLSGSVCESFYTSGDYQYAFVNYLLYDVDNANSAYIKGELDGVEFRIPTGCLSFEIGKYYVYNELEALFEVPEMEEGEVGSVTPSTPEIDPNIKTIVLPPNNEIWYTTVDGNQVDFSGSISNTVSNTYENGVWKCRAGNELRSLDLHYLPTASQENIKSLILPSTVTNLSSASLLGLHYADLLVLPENLSEVGTDFICGFGEDIETDKHIYFLSANPPATAWRAIWNIGGGTYYIHYPQGADYSTIDSCMKSWAYYCYSLDWVMVETNYNIIKQ